MKASVQARRDTPAVIVAVAAAALVLVVVGRWLDGPDMVADSELPLARPMIAVPPAPRSRVAVARDDNARARLAPRSDGGAGCRAMVDHIRSLGGAGDDHGYDYDRLCDGAEVPPGFSDCVKAASAPDGLVACAVRLIPDDGQQLFTSAMAAFDADVDLDDRAAYDRAVGEILQQLDDDERDQVIAMIHRSIDRAGEEEEQRWHP